MNRIKSIDGLRAISITMVLLGHAAHTLPKSIAESPIYAFFSNSALGVKVFFVISGYLITRLLLLEEKKTGSIHIGQFYIRRVFRIFPVFYLYILVVLLLKWFVVPDMFGSYSLVVFAGLYLWNYKHLLSAPVSPDDKGNWFFGHFWSLSMEEQFYLLWPLAFKKLTKIRLIQITITLILVMPIIRLLTYFFVPDSRGQIGMMLHTGGDAILTGCLGALLENKILNNRRILTLLHSWLFVTALCLFLFIISPMLSGRYQGAYFLPIGITLNNMSILFILLWSIHVPSRVATVLNSAAFVQVGVLSYSLYVWQQLFLTDKEGYWPAQFPQNLLLAVAAAVFSYYVLEKPILKLKDRFKATAAKPVLSQQPETGVVVGQAATPA
ncbi:acyltransferase family protein [Fibrella aquatilis]|uniref:Acyltransferase n=1 Tax=Fibrella aquatilis TaxID=2817059 RepID=A0A939G7B1_9BACT|nr:acyltransferase [Fibrella aquatilis]MBO0933196.1 acyltransferase [Fibrella aquatilis]